MQPPAPPLVLVLTSTLPRWPGDTEPSFVLDLAQALAGRYRIRVLAPHAPGAAPLERRGGVEIERFRYGPEALERLAYEGGMLPRLRRQPWLWPLVPVFLMALVWAAARALRRERVALVHAHWLIPQGVCARLAQLLAGRRVPMVCTAHGADVFGLRGGFARRLQRWVARGSARIGAVSKALGDELESRGVSRELIRVLPMGVAVPEAPADAGARDAPLAVFVGRIVEKKGVGVLLDAFHQLAATQPQLRLVIAGGGPDLPRYREQARALGLAPRVEFLGPVPHERVASLFAKAAVAVMPSVTARGGDAEGLGLVMLEAMATGCPVVVSDLAVVRDVLRPGENGLVFPEGDAPALAEAMARVLADRALAARLGRAGFDDVRRRFSWAASADAYDAAYRDALAGG